MVAYGGTGTDEVIGSNEGGFLVPNGDVDALARALVKLESSELRDEMGPVARERMLRLYDLPNFMAKLLEIYDEVLLGK